MKKLARFTIPITMFLMLLSPAVSFAAGLVACDGTITNPCEFTHFMNLINTVIRFILFNLAVPIAAIMFAYAGFLMLTSGGAESKTKAKNIFTNAVIGLVIAAGAFLIIKTILSILSPEGTHPWAWIGF